MKWEIEHYVDGGESEFPLIGFGNLVSHIGQIKIRKPITDVIMRVGMEEPFEFISVIAYSVVSETQNSLRTHLTYGSDAISEKRVERYGRLCNYVMTDLDLDAPINDAINNLHEI